MTPLYVATASATSGREGKISTDDGTLDHALTTPKGLGGPGGAGTNPEQLFAAGYAACFGSAAALVARQLKVAVKPQITAKVTLGKTDAGGFGLAVELTGTFPEIAREQAEAIMKGAHEVCPYSNATRNNIEVKLIVA